MANYRAIGATCEAIVRLLQQSWRPELFDGANLQFAVYNTRSFSASMETGVSLFLYRVIVNSVQRNPPGRTNPDGSLARSMLPLDLHFLLTPWAKDVSLEQEILGWAMRVLENYPLLAAGLLNSAMPQVFQPDETIEILPGQITNEELFRIWDVLPADFQISVPYVARVVRIESELSTPAGEPVLVRQLDYGKLVRP